MESLRFANSYTRLPALIDLYWLVDGEAWLTLLGDNWTGCDNTSAHLRWLGLLLPRVGPVRAMMTTDEQAKWDALPDRVTIYRGARRTLLGASWSLDRETAAHFPFLTRYSLGGDAMLITA